MSVDNKIEKFITAAVRKEVANQLADIQQHFSATLNTLTRISNEIEAKSRMMHQPVPYNRQPFTPPGYAYGQQATVIPPRDFPQNPFAMQSGPRSPFEQAPYSPHDLNTSQTSSSASDLFSRSISNPDNFQRKVSQPSPPATLIYVAADTPVHIKALKNFSANNYQIRVAGFRFADDEGYNLIVSDNLPVVMLSDKALVGAHKYGWRSSGSDTTMSATIKDYKAVSPTKTNHAFYSLAAPVFATELDVHFLVKNGTYTEIFNNIEGDVSSDRWADVAKSYIAESAVNAEQESLEKEDENGDLPYFLMSGAGFSKGGPETENRPLRRPITTFVLKVIPLP